MLGGASRGFSLCRVNRVHVHTQGARSPAAEVRCAVQLAEGSRGYLMHSRSQMLHMCFCTSVLSPQTEGTECCVLQDCTPPKTK